MREKYESLSAVVLRDLAKARGLKNISGMKKSDLVELMLAEDERQTKEKKGRAEAPAQAESRRDGSAASAVEREGGSREGGRETGAQEIKRYMI